MNSKQIYELTDNVGAYGLESTFQKLDSELVNYHRARCYHPVKIKVFDSHTGSFVERSVPCGRCYHCQETKVNEWVTRLYAHCEHFKYVYFVTLTYRTYEDSALPELQKRMDFMRDYLKHAVWLKDSFNFNHRNCWRPCVLHKSHYQNFLKRLRNHTLVPFTYLLCGEYGSRFGSPHWHMILFSNQPIYEKDIKYAWGITTGKDSSGNIVVAKKNSSDKQFFSFGRIEFDDLVENGTFADKDITIDGKMYNSRKCFAYVAKYCCKKNFNDIRVKEAFNYINNNDYEKENSLSYWDFRKQVSPFISVSRGTPIGSLWLKTHIDQMAQGVTIKPPLQTKGAFIFPSYFRRKISEYIYSLRTISPTGSFRRDNLPLIAANMASFISSDISAIARDVPITDIQRSEKNFRFFTTNQIMLNCRSLLRGTASFIDIVTKHRFIPYADWSHGNSLLDFGVYEFKYVRPTGWVYVGSHDLESWCLYYLSSMPKDFANYLECETKRLESEKYYHMLFDFYAEYDKIDKFEDVVTEIEKQNDSYFKLKNVRFQQSKFEDDD